MLHFYNYRVRVPASYAFTMSQLQMLQRPILVIVHVHFVARANLSRLLLNIPVLECSAVYDN